MKSHCIVKKKSENVNLCNKKSQKSEEKSQKYKCIWLKLAV